MKPGELTLDQIWTIGHTALLHELGPVGYIRFIQQMRPGRGDYTSERANLLDQLSAQRIGELLEVRRTKPPDPRRA